MIHIKSTFYVSVKCDLCIKNYPNEFPIVWYTYFKIGKKTAHTGNLYPRLLTVEDLVSDPVSINELQAFINQLSLDFSKSV